MCDLYRLRRSSRLHGSVDEIVLDNNELKPVASVLQPRHSFGKALSGLRVDVLERNACSNENVLGENADHP